MSTGLTSEVVCNNGHVVKLRTKTVKLLEEPTVEELTAEIELMTTWLPHIVQRDAGLDLNLEQCYEDAVLNELDTSITGEARDLTWMELVGIYDSTPKLPPPNE